MKNPYERKCIFCDGIGVVQDVDWQAWWNFNQDPPPANHFLRSIPEEHLCRCCRGRGRMLTSEGQKLVDLIKFWIKER